MSQDFAPPFRIKICGVTSPVDALVVCDAGADAIGLNFYGGSPRHVSPETAEASVAVLPEHVCRVGVFVNATDDEVCRAYDQWQLDLIQLHGDEPPEFLAALGERPVIRAYRVGPDGLAPLGAYLEECRALRVMPQMILLDARVPGQFGGSGETVDKTVIMEGRDMLGGLPLVLAGGLTPENVASAVRAVRPAAVDTASGVESSPGRKDASLIRRFVAQVAAAFDSI